MTTRFSSSRTASVLVGLAAGLLAFAVQAQTFGAGGPMAKDSMPGKDSANTEAAFARADANNDGLLSPQEAARMPAIAAKFATLDKNKDGVLSKEEFAEGYVAPN